MLAAGPPMAEDVEATPPSMIAVGCKPPGRVVAVEALRGRVRVVGGGGGGLAAIVARPDLGCCGLIVDASGRRADNRLSPVLLLSPGKRQAARSR